MINFVYKFSVFSNRLGYARGATLLALMPILTSTGRGADVMIPMAIPSFGGMVFAILTTFVVPIIYSIVQERKMNNLH